MSQGISVQSTILHFRPTRRLQIAKGNCQILFMYVRLRNPSITLCTASLGDKLKNLKTDREKSWDVQTTKWGNKTTPPPTHQATCWETKQARQQTAGQASDLGPQSQSRTIQANHAARHRYMEAGQSPF